jgi:hypothetical protein
MAISKWVTAQGALCLERSFPNQEELAMGRPKEFYVFIQGEDERCIAEKGKNM